MAELKSHLLIMEIKSYVIIILTVLILLQLHPLLHQAKLETMYTQEQLFMVTELNFILWITVL